MTESARSASLIAEIAAQKFADEGHLAHQVLNEYRQFMTASEEIQRQAESIVIKIRERRSEQPLLDAFMQEFGLSNQEGIALMCLAEALLRVPDTETADELIADKLLQGDWSEHLGQSQSLFVNASTWALMLTGRVVALEADVTTDPQSWLGSLVNRAGAPVIRSAMMNAMRILGSEFVLGRTMDEAVQRGAQEFGSDAIYSFDMLGEGARDKASADRYFEAYAQAIDKVGEENVKKAKTGDAESLSSISIKLSALHPRYEFSQWDRVKVELSTKLNDLVKKAASQNVAVTIDAEEADRLEMSLNLIEELMRSKALRDWNGFGLAVQAYGKRARPVIDWLTELARETRRIIPVRLVKGAYWDSEIKHAQELGLPDFAVFTRKATTDLSYLVCAHEILSRPDRLYAQFATHNAHTIVSILALAGASRRFEFQRLYGMGTLLYEEAQKAIEDLPSTRIYAPVGGHKDLLAYLVRRLLENGANSSFVNRFMDLNIPASRVVRDPADRLLERTSLRHPVIRQPKDLFGQERANSAGLDLSAEQTVQDYLAAIAQIGSDSMTIRPIIAGNSMDGAKDRVSNPAKPSLTIGNIVWTQRESIASALESAAACQPFWDNLGGAERAVVLDRTADLLEERRLKFVWLLIREAGKCHPDAIAEVREAVDFCRYYALEARRLFGRPQQLVGPTGERNELSLHGRGAFVCISPWNFPLAIFLGQVAAALASGNTVIAKPSEKTPLVAGEAINLLIESGVPAEALHFLPGDGALGAEIVAHPLVAGVAFTGSTGAAQAINRSLAAKDGPIVPLIAETGGQNVMIVDSTALLEQVTDDVMRSAFNSAGQRCSALRVLFLHEGIADDAIQLLCGAMDELRVGDPMRLKTDVGPIIDAQATRNLQEHVDQIAPSALLIHSSSLPVDSEQGWYFPPHLIEIESITELTKENFGPILHVIRYTNEDLEKHLFEVKQTGFALTFGIHSRIEGQTRYLFENVPAGNVYVNRDMVGAVVGVQPFGGQGLSGTGPKAGGPHYLARFATERVQTVNTAASGGNADLLRMQT